MPRRPQKIGKPAKATAENHFEFVIKTRIGQVIQTVGEAFEYIEGLSEKTQRRPDWQLAINQLHLCKPNACPLLAGVLGQSGAQFIVACAADQLFDVPPPVMRWRGHFHRPPSTGDLILHPKLAVWRVQIFHGGPDPLGR